MVKLWTRFDRNWVLVLVLAVFAIAPLTYPGFFQVHSGFLPAFNAAHLADAPNWGRSADPLRGEGKLPYLLVGPIAKATSSGVIGVKWGYGLGFLLGALGVYLWTRRWLGTKGAVVAAAVYTYLPWHLASVYVRGAYAEAWLWAGWPLLLWAVDLLAEQRPQATISEMAADMEVLLGTVLTPLVFLILLGLLFLALLLTQVGLTVLFILLLFAYATIVGPHRQGLIVRLALALALFTLLLWSLGRSALEPPVPFAEHLLFPFQLFSSAWGFGPSVAGWQDGLPFQLGVAAVGLGLVAVALAANSKQARRQIERPLWFWLAALLVLLVLTLPVASFLWEVTGVDALLTYPWQVLALTGLPLAFLAGSVVRLDRRLAELPIWAGLLALVILASYPYLAPRFTQVDPGPEPVAMFQPLGADAPQILILDEQIAPPTEITPTLTLTLTWQAVAPVADDYTVFVHLLAGADTKVAQIDTRPCGGECPTDAWQPGEIVGDRYQLSVPSDAAPGPYRLAVGLYLLGSGERAAVVGRDDQTVYFDVP